MLTVESTRMVLDRFGIGFTEGFVLSCIQRGTLERVAKPHNGVRDSKYGYAINRESLIKMLLNRGMTEEEINAVLPVQ